MATVLHPKGNRITVLRDQKETKTEGGLDIPDNVTLTDHLIGTVLEAGQGVVHPNARFLVGMQEVMAYLHGEVKAEYSPGDRVLYSRFAGIDATVGGKNICILEDREIIGVLEVEGE